MPLGVQGRCKSRSRTRVDQLFLLGSSGRSGTLLNKISRKNITKVMRQNIVVSFNMRTSESSVVIARCGRVNSRVAPVPSVTRSRHYVTSGNATVEATVTLRAVTNRGKTLRRAVRAERTQLVILTSVKRTVSSERARRGTVKTKQNYMCTCNSVLI